MRNGVPTKDKGTGKFEISAIDKVNLSFNIIPKKVIILKQKRSNKKKIKVKE